MERLVHTELKGEIKMSIERLLYEEVESQVQEIHKMQLGSDECVKAINAMSGMVDRIQEAEKIKNEYRKLEIEERKNDIEERKVESERFVQSMRNGITIAIAVIYATVEVWAHVSSKQFEQDYTHTTDSGRTSTRNLLSLFSKVKP